MKLYYIIIFFILLLIFLYLKFYCKENYGNYESINNDNIENEENLEEINNITENERDVVLNIAEYYYNSVDNEECAICFEKLHNTNIRQFSCMHKYHKDCILEWNKIKINNIQCPECGK